MTTPCPAPRPSPAQPVRRSRAAPSRARSIAAALLAAAVSACSLNPGAVPQLVNAPDARDAVVMTTSGPVIGVEAPQGSAFLGIPYAAPPVGPLRWRAPQPPAPWGEPRDATRLGSPCMQSLTQGEVLGQRLGLPLGDEDCLTLNVYAPAAGPALLASADLAATPRVLPRMGRRPVMVWLYGGGFHFGASGWYDPSVLAQKAGVVVVSLNYRLGALGFLAHPALRAEDPGSSSSLALLDQQAALRWVKANIAAFGGDPGNVTLFGESAGGWSTCFQLASPGAAGLFHRAIIESGACTLPNSVISRSEAERGGLAMAAELGCADPATAAACLREKSGEQILRARPHRPSSVGQNGWSPVVGDALLPLDPREAFARGRFNRVPVINGTNLDEGRLFAGPLTVIGQMRTAASYAAMVNKIFGQRAPAVLAEYPPEPSPGIAFATVVTDAIFACPARRLNRLLAPHVAVHAYEFADPETATTLPPLPGVMRLGAYHAGEIAYVMQSRWVLADPASFTPPQRALSDTMQGYWTTFARNGNPNAPGAPPWPALRGNANGVLSLAPDRIGPAEAFSERHRCAFWARLDY
jgi:para-nitrobenzyl esterase